MEKTKVINSCLNPVWNEELTFSLALPVGALNLVRFLIISFLSAFSYYFYHRFLSKILFCYNCSPMVNSIVVLEFFRVS